MIYYYIVMPKLLFMWLLFVELLFVETLNIVSEIVYLKYFQNRLFGENYMLKTIENRECRLTMAQEELAMVHFYMAAPKNSSYSKMLFEEYIHIHYS